MTAPSPRYRQLALATLLLTFLLIVIGGIVRLCDSRLGFRPAGFVLVAAQGALGGAVVEENLEEELVAAHLCLAMLLLAVLLWIWRSTRPELIGSDPPQGGARYRPLAWVASGLV